MSAKNSSHQLAAQLRKLAEHFESQPDTPLPSLTLTGWAESKDELSAVVRILPKPLEKSWPSTNDRCGIVRVTNHFATGLDVDLTIWRDRICRKVQDEVWECEPAILRDELEAIA